MPLLLPSCFSAVLLAAIMKNGSAAGGGAYCRKPAASGNVQGQPNNMKDSSASAAGESGKAYTKDQLEGVQRYCFKYI